MRIPLLFLSLFTLASCKDEKATDTGDTAPGDTSDTSDSGDSQDSDTGTSCWQAALGVVETMVGTYEGFWEMWGLDAKDQPVSVMTWTDVAVASNPQADDARAWAETVNDMKIDPYGPMQVTWIEGVLVTKDCGAGVRFIEQDGVVTEMPEIEPDHYSYQAELSSSELRMYENVTTSNLVLGYHVMDKLVTRPEGVETHDVSRLTHLEYDREGTIQVVEFTSLLGQHRKVK